MLQVSDAGGTLSGFVGARGRSVRQRFHFARQLMAEGRHSVLMHDADVFFRRGGVHR